jgi:uncharacterized protein
MGGRGDRQPIFSPFFNDHSFSTITHLTVQEDRMRLQRFAQLEEFCAQALPFLLQQPVHHNLLLGMVDRLAQQPRTGSAPYLAIVTQAAAPVAVAMSAPPYGLVLSDMTDLAAVGAIGQDLATDQPDLPSVNALAPIAEAFTQHWQVATGRRAMLSMAMKINRLTVVAPPVGVSGALRAATAADCEWVLPWYAAFHQEAWGFSLPDDDQWLAQRLQQQDLAVWQDHVPVTLVQGNVILGELGRIFLVYTPPAYRRRGYASAAVAAMSQGLLDRGARSGVLFTDLANATANKIYQAVGYTPVCDWLNYKFGQSPD